MNIAILLNHMNKGGLTSYVIDAAEGLLNKGHKVWALSRGGELEGRVPHIYLPVKGKNAFSPHNLLLAGDLTKIINEYHIEVLWAHTRITSVISQIASLKAQAAFLTTAHGFYRKNIGRMLFPCWGEKVIAISNAVKTHLTKDHHIPESRISVIYNGINSHKIHLLKAKIKQSKSIARDRMGINADEFVFGMLARISYAKGHKTAIEAFSLIAGKYPAARMFFVGKGNNKEERTLLNVIKNAGLEERILWFREIKDVSLFWGSIDVFLAPSINEGLGLSPIEAQMLSVPVIASDAGGLKEVVIDRETGRLFPTGDAKALSVLMEDAIRNFANFTAMAKTAEKTAFEKFGYNRFVEEIESMLTARAPVKTNF